MNDLEILKRIAGIPTTSFYEHLISKEIKAIFKEIFPEGLVSLSSDNYGNLIAHYQGAKGSMNPTKVAYVVHMDHPGFHLSRSGLEATLMDGLNVDLIVGSPLNLIGLRAGEPAVISKGRIVDKYEEKLYAVAPSAQNCQFATLDLGGFGMKADRIISPVLDDYASIAMSIAALKQITVQELPLDVYVVFHRAEEVGLVGAYCIATSNLLPKDCLIYSVETSSYKKRDEQIAVVGGGIIVRTGDASTAVFNRDAIRVAEAAAMSISKKSQERRMDAGSCEATLYYALGYRAAGLCLPLVAWHNNGALEGIQTNVPEQVNVDDFFAGTQIMVAAAKVLVDKPALFTVKSVNQVSATHSGLVEYVRRVYSKYLDRGFLGNMDLI